MSSESTQQTFSDKEVALYFRSEVATAVKRALLVEVLTPLNSTCGEWIFLMVSRSCGPVSGGGGILNEPKGKNGWAVKPPILGNPGESRRRFTRGVRVVGKFFPRRFSDSSVSSLKRWNLQVGKKRRQAVERALREEGSLCRKSVIESVSSGARSVRDMAKAR